MADDLQEYTNYFNYYLRNTLGISAILDDGELNSTDSSVTLENHWVFIVENLNSYQEDEITLLYKMINAVGLNETDFVVLDLATKELATTDSNKIFHFKDNPVQPNETYSPRILLREGHLKRTAWDVMKKFFKI